MIIDSHSIVHSAILTILYCIIFMNLFPCVKFNCCCPYSEETTSMESATTIRQAIRMELILTCLPSFSMDRCMHAVNYSV